MTTDVNATTTGIVLSGADEALYFIPDEALATFRLTEEAAAQVRQALASQDDTQGYLLPLPPPLPVADLPLPLPRVFLPMEFVRYRRVSPVAATPIQLP